MSTAQVLQEALRVIVLGMGTVLITLYILSLILEFMEGIITSKKTVKKDTQETVEEIREETSDFQDEELVAVITAALSHYLDRPISSIKIGSIRRLHKTTPSWAVASRMYNVNNKL